MVLTFSLSRSAWLSAVMEMGTACWASSRLRAVTTTFSSPWPSAVAWVRGAVPAVSDVALTWAKAGLARVVVAKRAKAKRLDMTFPQGGAWGVFSIALRHL